MKFKHLYSGHLLKRYKRFLADIQLESGEIIVAHCANTGSMTGMKQPGSKVWVSYNDNPKRKLAWSWELIEINTPEGSSIASVNTSKANVLVREALERGAISMFNGWEVLNSEVRVSDSRLDFCLEYGNGRCFIEVKQVTLLEENGRGYFPDAVSARALKHLQSLSDIVGQGDRAVLLFCVAHSGINSVRPATHIDFAYAQGLRKAISSGVEIVAYGCSFIHSGSDVEILLDHQLPVITD